MIGIRHARFGGFAACVLAISLLASGRAGAQESPMFQVKAEGDDVKTAISVEANVVRLDIRSRSGIGQATFERVSGSLPEKIVVRLYLKGLEEFRLLHDLSREGAEVIVRVSSSDGSVTQSLCSRGDDEQPITSASSRWLGVRIVSDQTTQRIPLNQGHFEITLPKDFLREGSHSFSIRWIDFYR